MGFIDWVAKWTPPVRHLREVLAARRFSRLMRSVPASMLAALAESTLGRASTPDEVAYLATPGAGF